MSARIAEHLVILNDFGEGLLNRAYNVLKFDGVKNLEVDLDKFIKVRFVLHIEIRLDNYGLDCVMIDDLYVSCMYV